MTNNKKSPITIAYSPDTDDAFMVHAMRTGLVDTRGYEFEYTAADIQRLNASAREGVYDVTAISIAAYPDIADAYLLMPIGASIGDAFGPAIIVSQASPVRELSELRGRKIAVPGRQTSAFFAARALIGDFDEIAMPFDTIADAVRDGTVDAGILIHELQLECERRGFRKLGDLGQLWHDAYRLPLPLGASAIKRSLGDATIADVNAIMRASIEAGLASREQTLAAALAASAADLDLAAGERYISMYVNHRSLNFASDVKEAMAHLFDVGYRAGLCRSCDIQTAFCE